MFFVNVICTLCIFLCLFRTQMENQKLYELLIEAGVKLEARCTTSATAAILLYKFMKNIPSDVEFCPYTAAAACLYLAGKLEEDLLKIRDVINVCHRILHPEEPPLEVDDQYWDLREGLGKLEMLVLRTLQFKLITNHPHKYLLHYANSLQNWVPRNRWEKIPVVQTAWTLLRDCYVFPSLIVKNDPREIAISVLYVSLKVHGEEIPNAESNEKNPWWKIFYNEMKTDKLLKISHQILDIYDNNKRS